MRLSDYEPRGYVGRNGHAAFITELCKLVSNVYSAIDPLCRHASDGFCDECPNTGAGVEYFRHDGKTLEFIRQAVQEKFDRDLLPVEQPHYDDEKSDPTLVDTVNTIATLTAERDGLREQHVAIDAAKQERGQH